MDPKIAMSPKSVFLWTPFGPFQNSEQNYSGMLQKCANQRNRLGKLLN